MSIETSSSKLIPVSEVISSETESPKAAAVAATHANKSQPADNNEAVLAAAHPKVGDLQLLLRELSSPDSMWRVRAAAALGRMADVAAVPARIAALGDADAE